MQKIYFKKMIDLNHSLRELISVSVDESINYKMESQGMRAYGSIMINGEYKDDQEKKKFLETIDLDIMAQYAKIVDKKEFCVKVEDFDYTFVDGNLSLSIQACIYGVKDDEDRVVETDMMVNETHENDISEDIEQLLREEDEVQEVKEVIPQQVVLPVSENLKSMPVVEKEEKVIDDEDESDIGTYYLYVVQEGDTYHSIAARYQVDEYRVQEYNHDRTLDKGTIVIIPYFS